MAEKTTKRTVKTGAGTVNINVTVPDFAKDKTFPVRKGRVTSAFSEYTSSIFVPGYNPDSTQPASRRKTVSKASGQQDSTIDSFANGIAPPVDPATLVEMRTYNAYHDRSIRIKALATCGQGYDILPVDEKLENYETQPNFKKLKEFTENPNASGERFIDIIKGNADDYYTFRYAYLELVPNGKGEIKEIFNLRAPHVRVKKYYGKIHFIQQIDGKTSEFALFTNDRAKRDGKLNEVLWIKDYYSKSKYYAMPDYYSAVGDIMLDRSSVEYNISRFKNGMMIDFIIVVEGGEVDSKVLEDINNFLTKNYKGLLNAGKALYLNSDSPDVKIRIEKVSAEIKDASFLKQREFSRDVVMVAHGMNAKIWGLQTPGQLGAGEGDMQFRLFEELIGKPDRQMFQDKINQVVKYGLGIDDFFIQLKAITVESWKDLLEALQLAPWLSDDEKRMEAGYQATGDNIDPVDELQKINGRLRQIKKAMEA